MDEQKFSLSGLTENGVLATASLVANKLVVLPLQPDAGCERGLAAICSHRRVALQRSNGGVSEARRHSARPSQKTF